MAVLYDSMHSKKYRYPRSSRLCIKYWNAKLHKAIWLQMVLTIRNGIWDGRYQKIQRHKHCVYVTIKCSHIPPIGERRLNELV